MANQIHQHPDGTISVRVDDRIYSDTEKNFKKDFGGSLSTLPPGFDERLYEQGIRHALSAKSSVIDGGPMPWSAGDTVIGKLDEALANQQKRLDDDFKVAKKKVDDEAEKHQKDAKERVEELDAVNEVKLARHVADREAKNTKQSDDLVKEKKKRDDELVDILKNIPPLKPLKPQQG